MYKLSCLCYRRFLTTGGTPWSRHEVWAVGKQVCSPGSKCITVLFSRTIMTGKVVHWDVLPSRAKSEGDGEDLPQSHNRQEDGWGINLAITDPLGGVCQWRSSLACLHQYDLPLPVSVEGLSFCSWDSNWEWFYMLFFFFSPKAIYLLKSIFFSRS